MVEFINLYNTPMYFGVDERDISYLHMEGIFPGPLLTSLLKSEQVRGYFSVLEPYAFKLEMWRVPSDGTVCAQRSKSTFVPTCGYVSFRAPMDIISSSHHTIHEVVIEGALSTRTPTPFPQNLQPETIYMGNMSVDSTGSISFTLIQESEVQLSRPAAG